MKGRKRLASGVLPDRLTRRKSAIKRIEPDLNPQESENETISNSFEREKVATLPLRQGSPTNEGHSGQICNTVSEIRKEKNALLMLNEVVKRLNDEQREAVVIMGFESMLELRTCSLTYDIFSWMTNQYNTKNGCFRLHGKDVRVTAEDVHCILKVYLCEEANEGLENELNLTIGEGKMISIILLKTILQNLRMADMEFHVKFIRYITAKFLCSTMKYACRCCWVPILYDIEKLGQLNWSKYVADFLENWIKLRNAANRASVSECILLLVPRKDIVELEALRSRLDSFDADIIKVKVELKSLRESVNQIGRNVELSQSKMMEALFQFMTFINEKYREGGDIQMDGEKTKKTRFEILPKSGPKNVQPLVDNKLNGHTIAKLVMPMSVLKMIDLRRLPNVVKFEILQNLWDLKKDPSEVSWKWF
ncbi:hypothetical protein M9H77_16475 [Catharanthus roseus]|uniref:Uncharacterized protein n=1 Tax=Catharanthus roseus TaxID=4058 RepID=A0ACC0B219_CATRO|nr:hypothetical protein M9H77_16475 [Catharanthus roseus]